MLASLVDAAARQVLDAKGLGEAFGHGTGHGLGLDVHEEPRVARRDGRRARRAARSRAWCFTDRARRLPAGVGRRPDRG